jgi:hypothetical protein
VWPVTTPMKVVAQSIRSHTRWTFVTDAKVSIRLEFGFTAEVPAVRGTRIFMPSPIEPLGNNYNGLDVKESVWNRGGDTPGSTVP